jgi:hypothetical protein
VQVLKYCRAPEFYHQFVYQYVHCLGVHKLEISVLERDIKDLTGHMGTCLKAILAEIHGVIKLAVIGDIFF